MNLVWNNAAGGFAGVAGNWNPAQVPTTADVLRFDLANSYTVTFGAGADSVVSHQLWGGDVTMEFNTTHGGKTQFYVASQAGQVATARVTSGTLRMGYIARVGTGHGSTGTLRVNGGTTNLHQNLFGSPTLDVGGDGSGPGTGEVIVLGGGAAELAGELRLGRSAGTGTLRVKGAGDTGAGLRRSHLFADSPTGDCRMGWEGSHGVLEVSEGGLFRVGRDLRVGEEAGDTGEITIGGDNLIDSAEVRVKDDLFLGANPSTLAGAAGGTATLLLDSLGVLVVDDSTVVGDPDGSSGLVTLRPGSRMMTKHLILRQGATPAVDLEGGLLQVSGGTLSTSTQRLVLPGVPDIDRLPALELLNGAVASLSGTPTVPPLVVGSAGDFEMRVLGGAQVTANGGSVVVSNTAGGFGYLAIGDGGQMSSDHSAVLGAQGSGTMTVYSGGTGTFDGMDLGPSAGSSGNLLVHAGGVVTCAGPFNLGGSTLLAGDRGWASVLDGGVLSLTAPVLAGTIWPASTGTNRLRVDSGGRVGLSGTLTVRDEIEMNGGDIVGGSLALRGDGRIEGSGNVECTILAGVDTTVAIVATGALEIGRGVPGAGVLFRGTLETGDVAVTVHDADSAVVGNVTLAGGQLVLPEGGGVVEAGKRLRGHGTVRGPVYNHGFVIGTGGLPLTFDGMLYGIGQGVSADLLSFLYGGGFEGSGVVDARVDAPVGSVIRATGDLTIGRLGAGNTSSWNGRFEVGPHTVALRGDGPVHILNGEFVLAGGRLRVQGASAITGFGGAVFRGSGEIESGITMAGKFSPGQSAGRLLVDGGVAIASNGSFEVDLGDHAAGEHDTLVVSGPLLVSGGTSLDLRLLPSFDAAPGDSFKVLECASLSGTFEDVTLDGAPLGGQLEVHYAADGVWIVVAQPIVGVGGGPGAPAVPASLRLSPTGSPGFHAGIELAMPAPAEVSLRVFDVNGRQVARLHDGPLAAGVHRLALPRDTGGAGVYFVRAVVRGQSRSWTSTARLTRLR